MPDLPSTASLKAPRRSRASMARRAARRERRRARRRQTVIAATLLGGLGLASLAGLYQWLGRDPASQAPRLAQAPPPDAAPASPGRDAPPTSAPRPLRGGLTPGGAPGRSPPDAATMAPAEPPATATRPAAKAATAACARPPCLPFMADAQVIDDGSSPDASDDQALSRSWAATLSSSQPMDQVVAYYRQQLTLLQRPGDPPLRESQPAPNQLLLTSTAPQDGAQQSVLITQAGPQLLIRLVRSLPASP